MSNVIFLNQTETHDAPKMFRWKVSYGMWKHGEVTAPNKSEAMDEALKFFRAPIDKFYLITIMYLGDA